MKHIAIITTSFPDRDPGSEAAGSFVEDFAEVLSRHVGVTVIAPSLSQRKDERHGNLTICRFTVPRLPLSLLRPGNPIHWSLIIKTLRAGRQAVQRLAGEARIDHILALWILPSGYWARNIWKSHGIPYSVWALGSDVWNLGKIPLVKKLLKIVLRDSFMCFADGYILKKDVKKISGKSCEFLASTRRLPTVKEKSLSTAPPYKLVYLGRWHHNKGTDILLDSLHLLSDENWAKIEEVRIFGGGTLEKIIKSGYAALKEVGRPVLLGGYLDKTQAAELLLWADYLLIPSRIESIPIIFSDAMQASCPVVTTPVGDLSHLIKRYKVGILSTEVSAKAFGSAICEALHKPPCLYINGLQDIKKQFDLFLTVDRLTGFINQDGS
jgi:glycosyltransferase involved in cell wall biosynthesis